MDIAPFGSVRFATIFQNTKRALVRKSVGTFRESEFCKPKLLRHPILFVLYNVWSVVDEVNVVCIIMK